MPYNAVGWFCDDVREERGNKETIVGVYSDTVSVPSFPGGFKRMVIYVRVHADVDQEINELRLFLRVPGVDEAEIANFDLEELEEGRKAAKRRKMPYIDLITQVTVEPLKVPSEGLVEATLELNDKRTVVAAMLVRKRLSRPIASERPSEQSPPADQQS
jgi:hypothetical protein